VIALTFLSILCVIALLGWYLTRTKAKQQEARKIELLRMQENLDSLKERVDKAGKEAVQLKGGGSHKLTTPSR
jgi:lipopolysaccharide biosynthesis regulator YciM